MDMARAAHVGVVVLALVLLAPAAIVGAEDALESQIFILHDVHDDGYTVVGNAVQFGYIVLTPEGTPTVHLDGKIRIVQNGVILYETHTTASAHDYDAMNLFTFTFTAAGPYTVEAEVPYDGQTLHATFDGVAHRPDAPIEATLGLELPPNPFSSTEKDPYVFDLRDAEGNILNHTDAIFEVRDSQDRLLFRTHTHTHSDPMRIVYIPQVPEGLPLVSSGAGAPSYVRLIGYSAFPRPASPAFETVTLVRDLGGSSAPFVSADGVQMLPPPPSETNEGGKNYAIYASYDPEDVASPFGNIRINAIVLDGATGRPVPHINFHAGLGGPGTDTMMRRPPLVFESETLHEYDGVFEMVFTPTRSGQYSGWITASQGEWRDYVEIAFTITPAGAPLAAGAGIVEVTGLDAPKSGEPTSVEFFARTEAGTAIQHSEIEFQIARDEFGVPLVWNKLHTHGDGRMGFDFTFPEAGDYWLLMDPETLEGEPVASYDFNAPGGGRTLRVSVSQGVPLPEWTEVNAGEAPLEGASSPGPSMVVMAVALAAAVLAFRRRT